MGTYQEMGWNFRMSGFQAAVLLVQLQRLDETLDRKTQSVAYLKRGLVEVEGLRFPREDPRMTRLTYLYPRLKYDAAAFGGVSAALFARALRAEGIPCDAEGERLLYQHPIFTEQRFFFTSSKRIDYTQVRCPVAEAQAGKSIMFDQTVLLSDRAALDDFIEAATKVSGNLDALKSMG